MPYDRYHHVPGLVKDCYICMSRWKQLVAVHAKETGGLAQETSKIITRCPASAPHDSCPLCKGMEWVEQI